VVILSETVGESQAQTRKVLCMCRWGNSDHFYFGHFLLPSDESVEAQIMDGHCDAMIATEFETMTNVC
jgi:hypothetical protein